MLSTLVCLKPPQMVQPRLQLLPRLQTRQVLRLLQKAQTANLAATLAPTLLSMDRRVPKKAAILGPTPGLRRAVAMAVAMARAQTQLHQKSAQVALVRMGAQGSLVLVMALHLHGPGQSTRRRARWKVCTASGRFFGDVYFNWVVL